MLRPWAKWTFPGPFQHACSLVGPPLEGHLPFLLGKRQAWGGVSGYGVWLPAREGRSRGYKTWVL